MSTPVVIQEAEEMELLELADAITQIASDAWATCATHHFDYLSKIPKDAYLNTAILMVGAYIDLIHMNVPTTDKRYLYDKDPSTGEWIPKHSLRRIYQEYYGDCDSYPDEYVFMLNAVSNIKQRRLVRIVDCQ